MKKPSLGQTAFSEGFLPQTRFFGPEMRSGPVAIHGALCYHNTYHGAPRVPLKDVYVV